MAIAVVILLGAQVAIPQGWSEAARFAAFAALTLCLWHATAGSMPLLVLAAVILFGALHEYRLAYLPDRASDAKGFLTDVTAALAVAVLAFMQRKPACAESSPQ